MEYSEIQRRIARLEFINDQLASELAEVDTLLRMAGFPHGIESAKKVALELLENGFEEKAGDEEF